MIMFSLTNVFDTLISSQNRQTSHVKLSLSHPQGTATAAAPAPSATNATRQPVARQLIELFDVAAESDSDASDSDASEHSLGSLDAAAPYEATRDGMPAVASCGSTSGTPIKAGSASRRYRASAAEGYIV